MRMTNKNLSYNSVARKMANRYPLVNEIITQVTFWVISYVVLSVIIFFARHSIIRAFNIPVELKLWPYAINSALMGLLFGFIVGTLEHYLQKRLLYDMKVSRIMLIKAIISIAVLYVVFLFRKHVLYGLIVAPAIDSRPELNSNVIWQELFEIIIVYTAFMSLVLNFMKEVNKKFGPGIMIPLLLGRYRRPKEQERIFIFMDLKSSTTIAENLGHSKYSSFIRDAFMDINRELAQYNAEIYQYVGDEIVVSWKTEEGLQNSDCVKFFFACEKRFRSREKYYLDNYSQIPSFKASLHVGKVIAVEVGDIKKDIAFHGDTLNTAARIQSMCNEYNKKLLVSDTLFEAGKLQEKFNTQHLGNILLKGKTIPVGIISIEE
jgi:adenylate cyclase